MYYFRIFFRCGQCSDVSSRVIKINLRSKFDACEKVGRVYCHLCISHDTLELVEVEELNIKHLEEFIQWATGGEKLLESTVDILGSQ